MGRSRVFSLLLLLLVLGCKGKEKDKEVITPGPGFDKVKLIDLQNNPIDLGQYQGKIIFLNFWATWCKPCIAEMPSIQEVQNKLQSKEIVFLLASSEGIEEISTFQNTHNYKFNYIRVENSEELNIQGLPTTIIFDQKGQVVFSEMGARQWNEKDNIDMILKIVNNNE